MKKIYKNVLLSLCAISVLGGCASKDVEYDGTSSADTNKAKTSYNTVTTDSAVDKIAGSNEQSVDSSISNSDSYSNANYESRGTHFVQSDIDGQTVVLNSVHFAFDKYKLTAQMREIATDNAATIDKVISSYGSVKVKLEGNCDEWGTDEYNYALGLKRAKTAKDALIADGIDENRIMMISFGESNPICSDKTNNCWKMNRRVDYRLLP